MWGAQPGGPQSRLTLNPPASRSAATELEVFGEPLLDKARPVEAVTGDLVRVWGVPLFARDQRPAARIRVETVGANGGQQVDEVGVGLAMPRRVAPVVPRKEHGDPEDVSNQGKKKKSKKKEV